MSCHGGKWCACEECLAKRKGTKITETFTDAVGIVADEGLKMVPGKATVSVPVVPPDELWQFKEPQFLGKSYTLKPQSLCTPKEWEEQQAMLLDMARKDYSTPDQRMMGHISKICPTCKGGKKVPNVAEGCEDWCSECDGVGDVPLKDGEGYKGIVGLKFQKDADGNLLLPPMRFSLGMGIGNIKSIAATQFSKIDPETGEPTGSIQVPLTDREKDLLKVIWKLVDTFPAGWCEHIESEASAFQSLKAGLFDTLPRPCAICHEIVDPAVMNYTVDGEQVFHNACRGKR